MRANIPADISANINQMLLSASDFKLTYAVCELRYENAYLLFDRTGVICQGTRSSYTNCVVLSAAPNQTTFQSEEGSFSLQLAQSSFSTNKPDGTLENFAGHCKTFFDLIVSNLEIKVFTRVGMRVFLRKDFKDLSEAKSVLASLKLTNLKAN